MKSEDREKQNLDSNIPRIPAFLFRLSIDRSTINIELLSDHQSHLTSINGQPFSIASSSKLSAAFLFLSVQNFKFLKRSNHLLLSLFLCTTDHRSLSIPSFCVLDRREFFLQSSKTNDKDMIALQLKSVG
jgi:hypothetical protein